MRCRWFAYLIGLLVVGATLVLVLWRPWQQRSEPAAVEDSNPPVDVASLTIVKRSGAPCGVTIIGGAGDVSNTSSAGLAAGEARSAPIRFPAPYTIEAVTVTRDGSPRRQNVKLTLAGGHRYELLINKDNSVAVTPASR